MALYHFFVVITMKILIKFLNIIGKEAGTLPGRISLIICKNIRDYIKFEGKIIVITGTNGKTTTNNLFYEILKREGKKVICNISGNNIDRGITSLLLKNCDLLGRVNADYLLLETEECYIPLIYSAKNLQIDSLVILNLFDDQLDRFGEVDNVVKSLEKFIINYKGNLILNGDDPNVVKLGSKAKKAKIFYYGVEAINRSKREKRETVICPPCQNKLAYDFYFYSNIGRFNCSNCGFGNFDYYKKVDDITSNYFKIKNEKYYTTNSSVYYIYNLLSILILSEIYNVDKKNIDYIFKNKIFNNGRYQKFTINNRNVTLYLGKNTTGINVLLNQIDKYKREKELLIILNDAENDGRDISWFWNIDFEKIKGFNKVFCSGTRAEEVAIALKVNNIDVKKIIVKNNFDDAISKLLISKNQKYIITNYSSLLKVRNILSNKER